MEIIAKFIENDNYTKINTKTEYIIIIMMKSVFLSVQFSVKLKRNSIIKEPEVRSEILMS